MPFFLEFSSYIAAFLVEDNVNIARILQLASRRLRHDGLTADCKSILSASDLGVKEDPSSYRA